MEGEFEEAFGKFIERRDYEEAESALLSIARKAFRAGWLAAGGDPDECRKIIEIHSRSMDSVMLTRNGL